jgi:hypothetical protein
LAAIAGQLHLAVAFESSVLFSSVSRNSSACVASSCSALFYAHEDLPCSAGLQLMFITSTPGYVQVRLLTLALGLIACQL